VSFSGFEYTIIYRRKDRDRFNEILKDANDRKFYDGKLRNGERREEFKNLTSIVNSIFMYFHSSEMHYKVRPKVFKDNINFFSHR